MRRHRLIAADVKRRAQRCKKTPQAPTTGLRSSVSGGGFPGVKPVVRPRRLALERKPPSADDWRYNYPRRGRPDAVRADRAKLLKSPQFLAKVFTKACGAPHSFQSGVSLFAQTRAPTT